MKYNRYFADGFRSCRLLATGHDPHRNRQVQVRMIPGEYELVGMHDGVDSWVAPVISPFLHHVKRCLDEILKGGNPAPILLGGEAKPAARKRVVIKEPEPEIKPRARRVLIEEPEAEVIPRRRTHVHS